MSAAAPAPAPGPGPAAPTPLPPRRFSRRRASRPALPPSPSPHAAPPHASLPPAASAASAAPAAPPAPPAPSFARRLSVRALRAARRDHPPRKPSTRFAREHGVVRPAAYPANDAAAAKAQARLPLPPRSPAPAPAPAPASASASAAGQPARRISTSTYSASAGDDDKDSLDAAADVHVVDDLLPPPGAREHKPATSSLSTAGTADGDPDGAHGRGQVEAESPPSAAADAAATSTDALQRPPPPPPPPPPPRQQPPASPPAGLAAAVARPSSAALLAATAAAGGGAGFGDAPPPNPLALLAKLDTLAAGYLYVAQHGGNLKARLFRKHVIRRYAEARGRVVLLRHAPGGPVHEIFSPVGAAVSVADTHVSKRGAVEHSVTVAKRGHTLQLRFASEVQAERWADVLATMGAARVPRLADFDVLAPIGEGASGKVFLVRDRKTGRKLALKCMAKSAGALATDSPDARHAIDERVTHEVMNGGQFIVGLRHAFQTRTRLYLATEFCDGGDVYNYVDSRGGGVSEDHARLITAQVILGIKRLHEANIVFRDLKPENALITGDGRIRLADFGLCKQFDAPSALTSTVCGTFSYAAADILSGDGYGRACDLWAVGIFLYHIMIGRPPRVSASVQEAKDAIFRSKEPIIWYSDVMSEAAMSLVTALIEVDPARRLGCGPDGIAALFGHPFFKGVDWAQLAAGRVPTDIRDALPAAELGDLRNFNQEEWAGIVMDADRDDPAYAEGSLWPVRNLVSHPLPADFVVSYAYSAEPAAKGGRHLTV